MSLRARRSRTIELSAEQRLIYADSSALVKLVIDEPESSALQRHLERPASVLATSQIALVEVGRAARVANPADAVQVEIDRLLSSCLLVAVSSSLLRGARRIASASVRTSDAIHIASALRIEPDELVAYDRRLLQTARQQGLSAVAPGGG